MRKRGRINQSIFLKRRLFSAGVYEAKGKRTKGVSVGVRTDKRIATGAYDHLHVLRFLVLCSPDVSSLVLLSQRLEPVLSVSNLSLLSLVVCGRLGVGGVGLLTV
jgi:hypothetical protein